MTSSHNRREEPARFFSTVTSLNNFDKLEIGNVIRGLRDRRQQDICFTAYYYRVFAKVESILTLNHVKHIQATGLRPEVFSR